jgi:tol-pal system beta propeller repeat protein TolB
MTTRRPTSLLLATAVLTAVFVFAPAGGAHTPAVTNGRIAFQSARPPGDASAPDIYTIDPDGSNTAGPLTPSNFTDGQPAFSPDGTKIAYSTFEFSGNPCCNSIAVMNADGSGKTKVINGDDTGSGTNGSPAWSPDGQKLAFVSNFGGFNSQIGTVGVGGGAVTQLTTGSTDHFNPAWSPDGAKIAFDTGHPGDIYTMNTDDMTVQQLTSASGDETQPAWSPDGTKIAYVSTTNNGNEIFVMDANGSNPVQLTNNGDDDEQPAWSPDGTRIAFWSDRYVADFAQHDREIYTMNASDGSNQTRVTDSAGDDTHPSWQSLAATDVVVTNCNDPALAQLTTITGDLIVDNIAGCTALSLPNLTYVGG